MSIHEQLKAWVDALDHELERGCERERTCGLYWTQHVDYLRLVRPAEMYQIVNCIKAVLEDHNSRKEVVYGPAGEACAYKVK